MLYPFSNRLSNFLTVSAEKVTGLAGLLLVVDSSVSFCLGNLLKIASGLNGQTPVVRKPDEMLLMVILLEHASENKDEK